MDNRPKDSAKRGLAAITEVHRHGWEGGTLSFESIARELGIRKQSVWAFAKRHGWERKQLLVEPEPPLPAPQQTPRRLQAASFEDAERDRLALIEANKVLFWSTLPALKGPLDVIGRQRIQATMRGIREELTALGHFGPLYELERERLPQLVIRRLTVEEEVEIQRRAEEGIAWSIDNQVDESNSDKVVPFVPRHGNEAETENHRTPAAIPMPDRQKAGNSYGGTTGNSCGGRLGNSDGGPRGNRRVGSAPAAGDERKLKQIHQLLRFSLPVGSAIPDRDHFRDWLVALADKHGKVTLQEMIKALGGTDAATYESKDREFLIAQILRLSGGDPVRLTPFVVH